MTDLPAELTAYVADLIVADIERQADHRRWLDAHPDEADRDAQIAAIERGLELASKAAAFFPSGD